MSNRASTTKRERRTRARVGINPEQKRIERILHESGRAAAKVAARSEREQIERITRMLEV